MVHQECDRPTLLRDKRLRVACRYLPRLRLHRDVTPPCHPPASILVSPVCWSLVPMLPQAHRSFIRTALLELPLYLGGVVTRVGRAAGTDHGDESSES